MQEIPYWERYMLTIREAAEYFHIGEKKMRQIVEDYEGADFIIMNGNRAMIKRKSFERFWTARLLSEFCHRNSVTLFFSGFMSLGMI